MGSKRTKLLIAVAVAIAALVPNVFAHGQAESSSSKKAQAVTLSIMDNYAPDDPKGKVKDEVFKAFMKKYPNIKISDQVYKDLNIPTKVSVAFVGGKEPDIVFSNYFPTVKKWLGEGIAVPINSYLKDWGLQGKFVKAGLDSFRDKNGKIAAFPFEGYNWPVWYNMKVAKAAGISKIPTTISEVMADIPKIRKAGYSTYVTAGNDGEDHQGFDQIVMAYLKPNEVAKVFHDGDWSLPDAVKGVELFAKLRDAGFFSKDTPGLTNVTKQLVYNKGNVFMIHAGSWEYSSAPADIQKNVKLGGFPLPAGSTYQHPFLQVAFTAKGVFITPNGAKKLNAVKDFITFLYAPENIRKFVIQSSMISPIRNLNLNGANLNPLFAQSMKLKNVSVMTLPDLYMPGNVRSNLISLCKEFYLTGSNAMSAPQMIAALTQLWQQAKK